MVIYISGTQVTVVSHHYNLSCENKKDDSYLVFWEEILIFEMNKSDEVQAAG